MRRKVLAILLMMVISSGFCGVESNALFGHTGNGCIETLYSWTTDNAGADTGTLADPYYNWNYSGKILSGPRRGELYLGVSGLFTPMSTHLVTKSFRLIARLYDATGLILLDDAELVSPAISDQAYQFSFVNLTYDDLPAGSLVAAKLSIEVSGTSCPCKVTSSDIDVVFTNDWFREVNITFDPQTLDDDNTECMVELIYEAADWSNPLVTAFLMDFDHGEEIPDALDTCATYEELDTSYNPPYFTISRTSENTSQWVDFWFEGEVRDMYGRSVDEDYVTIE